jgi:hypothetical protein
MLNFNNEETLNLLEPCPNVLYTITADVEAIVLFFSGAPVRENATLFNDNKSFFPVAQQLRSFVDMTINKTIFYYFFIAMLLFLPIRYLEAICF